MHQLSDTTSRFCKFSRILNETSLVIFKSLSIESGHGLLEVARDFFRQLRRYTASQQKVLHEI